MIQNKVRHTHSATKRIWDSDESWRVQFDKFSVPCNIGAVIISVRFRGMLCFR